MRITYRPSLDGSPANTAICAPFGNAGGAGPHFNWSAETATWSSAAIAGIDAKPATNNVVTKAIRNMLILPIASLCLLKLPHRDAKKKLLSTSKRLLLWHPRSSRGDRITVMFAIGLKRTLAVALHMSAFGGNRTVIARSSVIDHDSARTVIP